MQPIDKLIITVTTIFDPMGSLGNRGGSGRAKTIPVGSSGAERTFFSPQCLKHYFRASDDYMAVLKSVGVRTDDMMVQSGTKNMNRELASVANEVIEDHLSGRNPLSIHPLFVNKVTAGNGQVVVTDLMSILFPPKGGKKALSNKRGGKAPKRGGKTTDVGLGSTDDASVDDASEDSATTEPMGDAVDDSDAGVAGNGADDRGTQILRFSRDEMRQLIIALLEQGGEPSLICRALMGAGQSQRALDLILCGRNIISASPLIKNSLVVPSALQFSAGLGLQVSQGITHKWSAVDDLAEGLGAANLQDEFVVNGWHSYDAYLRVGEVANVVGHDQVANIIGRLVARLCRHAPRHGRAKGMPSIIGSVVTFSWGGQAFATSNVAKERYSQLVDKDNGPAYMVELADGIKTKCENVSLEPGEHEVVGFYSCGPESIGIVQLAQTVQERIALHAGNELVPGGIR